MTRNIFHITISFIILLLAFSCISENKDEKENVPVMLTFNTRSTGTSTAEGEGIKNLRVIIVQDGKVVKHETYEVSANATLASRTFTIFDVPVGRLDFYIIANHENSGINNWSPYAIGTTPDFTTLTAHVITADGRQMTAPFPITGKCLGVNISPDNRNLTFSITRSTVKLNLIFTNKSNTSIHLQHIELGSFLPDRTYLFPQESLPSIPQPEGTSYSPLRLTDVGITLPAEIPQSKTIYIFENDCEENVYTLSVTADGTVYPPLPIKITTENTINKMPRNTQVNINVGITPTSIIILNYKVVEEWTQVPVAIPPFN